MRSKKRERPQRQLSFFFSFIAGRERGLLRRFGAAWGSTNQLREKDTMQGTKGKRSLFGGALRGAGLAAATFTCSASAEFVPNTTYGSSSSHIFGWDESFAPIFDQNSGGAFAPTLNYTGNGLEVDTYASASVFGVSANVTEPGNWSLTWVQMTQYFTVDSAKEMLVEWDLTGWNGYINSGFQVYEEGSGFIFDAFANDAPGSTTIALTPGVIYVVQIALVGVGGDGGDGYGFVRFTNVPAPGALAMLGVGVLQSKRRRRRS
jgi:hypothetical protein